MAGFHFNPLSCPTLLLGMALLTPTLTQAQLGPPTQTVALQPKEALGGVVRFQNGTTVLLLGNSEQTDLKAVAVAATGQTAWTTKLARVQKMPTERSTFMSVETARATADRQSFVGPVQFFVNGSELFAVEEVSNKALTNPGQAVSSPLGPDADKLLIQRVTAEGQTTKATITPLTPTAASGSGYLMNQFGDGEAFYRCVEHSADRGKTRQHVLERYDLTTSQGTRITLPLGETPPQRGKNVYVYNRWQFLGHRPNQTYFVRRLLNDGEREVLNILPQFEIVVVDNAGTKVGGVSTTLDLPAGKFAAYSGNMPVAVWETYLAELHESMNYATTQYASGVSSMRPSSRTTETDLYRNSSGGVGEFYLDYETGDVLIYGEYIEQKLYVNNFQGSRQGFFLRRYALDGTARQQVEIAYDPAEVKKDGNAFEGGPRRLCNFTFNPVSQEYEFAFVQPNNKSMHTLVLNAQTLQQTRLTNKEWDKPPANPVKIRPLPLQVAGPVCMFKPDPNPYTLRAYPQSTYESRDYAQFGPQEAPMLAKLLPARTKAADADAAAAYFLSADAANKRYLLIEHTTRQGGQVNLYVF